MKKRVTTLLAGVVLLACIIGYVSFRCFGVQTYKQFFVQFNGLYQRLIGKNYIYDVDSNNTVVKLNNGYLTFIRGKAENTARAAERIIFLKNWLDEQNIPMIYAQTPIKVSKFDPQLPAGVADYSNDDVDRLLQTLQARNVDVLDFRQVAHDAGIDPYSMFFKTDHHWKPETALWAAGVVAEKLNSQYNLPIDTGLYDPESYTTKSYEQWFLGSQGKRVGSFYGGLDDISLITPNFETELTSTIPIEGVEKRGSFTESVMDLSKLEKNNYFSDNPYLAYTGGDYNLNMVQNHLVNNGVRVLLVRDSFGCAFSPFLALGVENLDIIDLRYYTEDGGLKAYIEQTRPDVVLFLYNNFTDKMTTFE